MFTKVIGVFCLMLYLLMFIDSSNSETINIDCDFNAKTYGHLKNLETCKVASIDQVNQENMDIRMLPSHNKPSGYKNIEGFTAINKEIYYFPARISTIFSNLKALTVKSSKLRKITTKDLRGLQYLEFLDLSYNELLILDSNLFQNNQNLTIILLNNNNLYYIDASTFNGLKNLKFLNLNDNICYSSTLTNLQQALETLNSSYCNKGFINGSAIDNLSFEYNYSLKVTQKNQNSSEFSGFSFLLTIFMIFFCYLFILLIMYLIHQSNEAE